MNKSLLAVRKYTTDECNQFVEDMQAAHLQVFHYEGRFSWKGPAVWVENNDGLKNALDSSTNPAQWDRYKEGYVIFPVKEDPGIVPA